MFNYWFAEWGRPWFTTFANICSFSSTNRANFQLQSDIPGGMSCVVTGMVFPPYRCNRHLRKGKERKVKLLSCLRLFATPWTIAYQAPLSMEFSRQEYWSGLPFPSPGDLPEPGNEPRSSALQADTLPSEPPGKPNRHLTSEIIVKWRWWWVLSHYYLFLNLFNFTFMQFNF